MTKREAAIVTAYTGLMLGKWEDFHQYAEEIMGRPVFTHEFGNQQMADTLKEKSYQDFISLTVEG